jgi:hypothetical protein
VVSPTEFAKVYDPRSIKSAIHKLKSLSLHKRTYATRWK